MGKDFLRGSALAALLFGVALAMLFMECRWIIKWNLPETFSPCSDRASIISESPVLPLFFCRERSYAVMKTEGELQQRAFRLVSIFDVGKYCNAVAYFCNHCLYF